MSQTIRSFAAGAAALVAGAAAASLFASRRTETPRAAAASRYAPPKELRDRVRQLPLYARVTSLPEFREAPFHPLLVDDLENPADHPFLPFMKSPEDIEGTLLRGRLLFRPGGVEFGSGWLSKDHQTLVMFLHLGDMICGHPGIVHGGLISAIFDDCMGYNFFADAAGKHNGFTASLKVDYRNKMPAGRTIAVCVRIARREGRKVFLSAEAHDAEVEFVPFDEPKTEADKLAHAQAHPFAHLVGKESTLFAQAEALFIIPRGQGPDAKPVPATA
ncbi:hypothetical protein HK105_205900 [Polyrhizophydium stewartii]|uniref:Thioesterase domain-containing protein n=1 Tax=Polyrhizophydium stewartii TaxID=2732419 RepID=A0ABR4N501_9FUNG